MSLSPGAVAPDFVARNQHGETVRLSDRAGRGDGSVLLVFYPWAFSGICTGELSALRDAHGRLVAAGVSVWAVSCDAMFTLRAFADAQHLPFDLLSDHWPHGAIASAYGVFDGNVGVALRGSFLIGQDGQVGWSVVNGIGEARDILAHVDAALPPG